MRKSKPKILVVEDNATNRLLLINILESDYDVIECSNGKEAIEKNEKFSPDLILMDVEMPVLNGLDACESIKSNPKYESLPIIFITAQDNAVYETAALSIGGADYITKPINANVTRARIKLQFDLINTKKERDKKIVELEKMVRIFELKFRARPVKISLKEEVEKNKKESDNEMLNDYVYNEHLNELEDIEYDMDAIINRMFLNQSIEKKLLLKLADTLHDYSKILRFYPIFNILGTSLSDLSILLKNNSQDLTQEYTQTVLTYFESLFFTLKHWREQALSSEMKNPNMYDASMLSDINMIGLTFENKLDSIENQIEFF